MLHLGTYVLSKQCTCATSYHGGGSQLVYFVATIARTQQNQACGAILCCSMYASSLFITLQPHYSMQYTSFTIYCVATDPHNKCSMLLSIIIATVLCFTFAGYQRKQGYVSHHSVTPDVEHFHMHAVSRHARCPVFSTSYVQLCGRYNTEQSCHPLPNTYK